ncbi:MAG: hypothetical protein ACJ8GN_07600 [Longimicrobiaceae bacterium]
MRLVHQVCDALADWQSQTRFPDVYLFGSLIHRGGFQFDPRRSDIDVVCVFGRTTDYASRAVIVENAFEATISLNATLMQLFRRADASQPIVSIVPLTTTELTAGLHKDGVDDFFPANRFISVTTREPVLLSAIHHRISPEIEGALSAIRGVQKLRNKALSLSPNGNGGLVPFDSADPLPKDLMRCAAQVSYALRCRDGRSRNPEERTDLLEGFDYVLYLVRARRRESIATEHLHTLVNARLIGRGGPHTIPPHDLLLLWEILAEDACALLPTLAEEPPDPEDSTGTRIIRARVSRPTAAVRSAVFTRHRNRCAFPGCGVDLERIGEIAAINSTLDQGPRYDADLNSSTLTAPDNFLALCPTHHRLIDRYPEDYPADYLRTWQHRA